MNYDGFGIYQDQVGAGTLTGSGTTNYVARFTGASSLGDSIIRDDGTTTGVGTAPVSSSYMSFAPATTLLSSLNITTSVAVDVVAPITGDLWWNGTELNFYDGADNVDLLASTTPSLSAVLGVSSTATGVTTQFKVETEDVSAIMSSFGSNDANLSTIDLSALADGSTNAFLEVENDGGDTMSIRFTTAGGGAGTGTITIYDEVGEKGVVYNADYSGNFTARSLVDKAYVDGVIGGTITASNGLTKTVNDIKLGGNLTADTTVTMSTNDLVFDSSTGYVAITKNDGTVGAEAGISGFYVESAFNSAPATQLGALFRVKLNDIPSGNSTTKLSGATFVAEWNQTTAGQSLTATPSLKGGAYAVLLTDEGTVSEAEGLDVKVKCNTANGTITSFKGYNADINDNNLGTITKFYGYYIPDLTTAGGTLPASDLRYGIYQQDAGNNYLAGRLSIGTTSNTGKLHVVGGDVIFEGLTDSDLFVADYSADRVIIGAGTGLGKFMVQGGDSYFSTDATHHAFKVQASGGRHILSSTNVTNTTEWMRLANDLTSWINLPTTVGLHIGSTVGIGVTAKLTVKGFTSTVAFSCQNGAGTSTSVFEDSNGRTGIGVTGASVTSKLTVDDAVEVVGADSKIILLDRTLSTRYEVYMDNGNLVSNAL